eukprot:gene12031-biopygen2214
MTSPEEVLGIVKGLADVVRDHHNSSKEVTNQTQQQIQDLSHAVADLSLSIRARDASPHQSIRLPPLSLPQFTGAEPIDRFAEQLTQVLATSGVSPRLWLTYLKQQSQKDSRAFDIICAFETSNATKFTSKTTPDEFRTLYDQCLQNLCRQRGIPKEEQLRQLLAVYYSMRQQPQESVSNFAHRFLETQHSLEKLLPGIHTSPDGQQLELIHAFAMKLHPPIAKDLLSRDEPFKSLPAIIEAAKRHESVLPSTDPLPKALIAEPNKTPPGSELTTSIKREVEKCLPQPSGTPFSASADSSQDPLFGMPAITALPTKFTISAIDLANKNILWTKVSSAGVCYAALAANNSMPDIPVTQDSASAIHSSRNDSTLLADFLDRNLSDNEHALPPTDDPHLDPSSEMFFTELCNALRIDTPSYAHVPQDIMSKFKGFRPRLNGATERVHRFLNSAIGIYCERFQERWEDYLQPAVYAHNTSAISGTSDITPFSLVFGRDAPSPETISFALPPNPLPADQYAKQLVSNVKDAHTHFQQIKSDLRRRQRELYDIAARDSHIPDGKLVYMRKDHTTSKDGKATRFIRNFDGPFLVIGHPYNRADLLSLRNVATGIDFPRPVNIEKVVVVPDPQPGDLRIEGDAVLEPSSDTPPSGFITAL